MSLLDSEATGFASFRADDTLVQILPNFDLPDKLTLSSSLPLGPFKAGLPSKVPLWVAILLEKRSFARISPPSWLNTDNLAEIIAFERKDDGLFHDETKLPKNYYELCKRLHHSLENSDAIALLIQDLLDIRLDKLRRQFQTHIQTQALENPDILLTFDTMGTQEIAVLQDFVVTALADQHGLAEEKDEVQLDENSGSAAVQPRPTSIRKSRVPLRKFRR